MADGSVFPPDHGGNRPDPEVCRAAGVFRLAAHPSRLQALVLLEGGARDAGRLAMELGLAGGDRLHALVTPLVGAGVVSCRREAGKSLFALTAAGARLLQAFRLLTGPGPALSAYVAEAAPGSGGTLSAPSGLVPATPAAAGEISASALLGPAADPTRLRLLLSLAEEGRDIGSLAGKLGRTGRVLRSNAAALSSAGLIRTRPQARGVAGELTEVGLGLVQVLRAACSRLDAPGGGAGPDRSAGLRVLDPTSADGLAGLLKVFADPVRLRLINLLAGDRSLCSCHLLDALDLPRRSIYQSVSWLKKAGLLVAEPEEHWVRFRLARYARDLHIGLVGYLGPRLAEAGTFHADRERLRSLAPCPGPLAEGDTPPASQPGRFRLA
jgi:ArsR family transcriptional regulator